MLLPFLYESICRGQTHLEDLVEDRVDGVLLHLGLPLAALGLVRQQVGLHVTEEKREREKEEEKKNYCLRGVTEMPSACCSIGKGDSGKASFISP